MRGISTVIATILLLVMIVVITAGVFYFFRGTLTTATTTGTEAVSGAISEADVQSNIRIANYAVVDAGGKNVPKLTISNGLDQSVNVTRIDIEDIATNQALIDCTNYTIAATDTVISGGGIKDICVNTTATLSSADDLKNKKVILYIVTTQDGKAYSITTYLS